MIRLIRNIGFVTIVTLALAGCGQQPPHNVLILFLDDFGYGDLALNRPAGDPAPATTTPVLDAFHGSSLVFTRHYTESTCSPSRAALMSGRYPARFGFTANGRGMPPEITTLPEAFRAAGHQTHFIGKWHLGHTTELAYPENQGFDTWLGFLNQWMLRDSFSMTANNLTRPTYMNPWLRNEQGEQNQFEGQLTDILTDNTIEFIESKSDSDDPWFLQVSYFAPHEPVEPSPEFSERYPDTDQGSYLALVEQLDANIGRILDSLENSAAADNTVVVIVSDNGGTEERYPSNAPYFGIKTTYTEGGVRTPLMIRWPDGSYAGSTYDYPVSLMDLYPTLLAASGIDYSQEQLDGQSLLQFIENRAAIQRPLFWESYGNDYYFFSVLDATHRYRYSERLLGRNVLMDLELNEFGEPGSIVNDPSITSRLQDDYLQWRNETHSLDLTLEPVADNGLGILTGDSFQRSPGHGGYTFAIAVQALQNQTGTMQQIAYQDELLDIHLNAGLLTAKVQDLTLSAPFPDDGQCHSIVLTANFQARISWLLSNLPMESPVQLFVDGELVSESVDRRELPKQTDLTTPTYIGFSPVDGQRNEFTGRLFEPLLFNHRVFANASSLQPSMEQLASSLCP